MPIQAGTMGCASSILHGSGEGLLHLPAMVCDDSSNLCSLDFSAMLCMWILACAGQLCHLPAGPYVHVLYRTVCIWTEQGCQVHSSRSSVDLLSAA